MCKLVNFKMLYRKGSNNFKLVVMLLITIFALAVFTKGSFVSINQISLVAYLFPEMGVLSLGMMLAMISGGIDLTVIAVADLAGILSCLLMKAIMLSDASMLTQILILGVVVIFCALIGAACGFFSGTLISKVGIPAMVATLGASDIILGLAIGITDGSSIKELPSILNYVTNMRILGLIPVTTLVFIICAAITAFVLNHTATGFQIYMIGSNKTAAKYAAIDTTKVIIKTYMLSGIFSSVAGLLMCGHFNSARSDFGKSYLTPAILICVLAGINPNGGKGKVGGMVLAVIILQVLSSGLSMFHNISDYYKNLIWGLVLIFVMIINVLTERKSRV